MSKSAKHPEEDKKNSRTYSPKNDLEIDALACEPIQLTSNHYVKNTFRSQSISNLGC